jgi:hypothetical protein
MKKNLLPPTLSRCHVLLRSSSCRLFLRSGLRLPLCRRNAVTVQGSFSKWNSFYGLGRLLLSWLFIFTFLVDSVFVLVWSDRCLSCFSCSDGGAAALRVVKSGRLGHQVKVAPRGVDAAGSEGVLSGATSRSGVTVSVGFFVGPRLLLSAAQ